MEGFSCPPTNVLKSLRNFWIATLLCWFINQPPNKNENFRQQYMFLATTSHADIVNNRPFLEHWNDEYLNIHPYSIVV